MQRTYDSDATVDLLALNSDSHLGGFRIQLIEFRIVTMTVAFLLIVKSPKFTEFIVKRSNDFIFVLTVPRSDRRVIKRGDFLCSQ